MPNLEAVTYLLVYRDGSTLDETEAHARGGFVACADRPDLASFVVYDDQARYVQVVMQPGMRPLFGRVWRQRLSLDDGSVERRRLHAVCAGWRRSVTTDAGEQEVKAIFWITPHDVFLTDRDLDEVGAMAHA